MFSLRYIAAELRRRRGRTLLTALGLGVGVGLVVTVTALSSGLDEAQSEVLEPLTGVGTDMAVSRPVSLGDDGGATIGGPAQLSPAERKRLEQEGAGPPRLDFGDLGDPGEKFETDQFVTTDLSFPAAEVRGIREGEGVEAVSPALTLNLIHVEGRVPESTGGPTLFRAGPGPAEGAGGGGFGIEPLSVTGVDATQRDLGLVKAEQVTEGRFLRAGERNAALLTQTYADENAIAIGDKVAVGERELEVVGLAKAPLGADASDVYMPLATLQKLSDREGRVNALEVRAADVDSVEAVADRIEAEFSGSQVTTARELSERVSGSLVQAQNLSDKLGAALAIVALAAAFLTASFLTLSSVNKRTRELGTLKALGWRQWRVVRQVSGESVAQGLIGGAFGAVIGIGGAAIVGALGISLEASAGAEQAAGAFAPPGGPLSEQVAAGTSSVTLGAPVDAELLALAIGLAVIGGLIAGAAGGVRAARLRPAEALRSVE
jgi:ABC-type antimicrobial peptide transport system permease subunit